MQIKDLGSCRICGNENWQSAHKGRVRDGTFGNYIQAQVWHCLSCGVHFLPIAEELSEAYYSSDEYREEIGEGSSVSNYQAAHDAEQISRLALLEGIPLRNAVIADVGCAAGSFLEALQGWAGETIAIEPSIPYHNWLKKNNHVFGTLEDAAIEWRGKVDIATCFVVVEHVREPVRFLADVRALLSPDGMLVLTTPNRRDFLLEACPGAYTEFFYRKAHAHYFEEQSLGIALRQAGFSDIRFRYHQRFGFTNFCNWLRLGRPTGHPSRPALDGYFENQWRSELERRGRSDVLVWCDHSNF